MMRNRSVRMMFTAAVIAGVLAGVTNGGTAAATDSAGGAYILAANNQIARAIDAGGNLLTAAQTVSGIASAEQLRAIGVRPLNNRLYGLTSNGAGAVRLYHIDLGSGVPTATPLGAAPVQFSDGTNPVAITGAAFDIDFNPTVDRIRVISDTGLNFRMNPNNGALVDSDANATNGVNPDGALNGGATTASATSYTNSFVNSTVTTQYTIDAGTNKLFIQAPPNNGTLTAGVDIKLGSAVLDFTEAALDIPSSVVVSAANAPATGLAYAVLKVANADSLYTVDLSSGVATSVGSLGTLDVLDLALAPDVPVGVALSGDTLQLQRFRLSQPGTVVAVAVSGITIGDVLVGIDGRPATGQTFGLGVNAAANTATLYLIDPQTGAATVVGTAGSVAYVDGSGNPVDLPDPTVGYGVDFNPTVDRVRIVTGSGLNLRANPVTGGAVDGDPNVAGNNPDGGIKGAATAVTATAYTNSFSSPTGATTVTTQYTLDSTANALLIQNPPNSGTQTSAIGVTVGGSPLDFTAINGFDIPTAVVAPSANAAVTSGVAYATLTVGGTASLYQIDLVSGAATVVGTVGANATGTSGLAVWTPINSPTVFVRFAPIIGTAK